MPNVFFVSNQPSFQTLLKVNNGKYFILQLYENNNNYYNLLFLDVTTRLISVPSFAATQTCVLLNLNTLDCSPISFKTFTP